MGQVRDYTPTRMRKEVTHQPGALQLERLSRKERRDVEVARCLPHEREPLDIITIGEVWGLSPSETPQVKDCDPLGFRQTPALE